jgi:hypothetical protein
MPQPEDDRDAADDSPETIARAIQDTIMRAVNRMTPEASLCVVAFMHLLEDPENLTADLDIGPSGDMRLVLVHARVSYN